LWLNQSPEVFGQLAQRLAETNLPAVLQATRDQLATTLSPTDLAQLSYDPFGFTRLPESIAGLAPQLGEGQSMFSGAEGKFRVLFVKARTDLPGYRECTEWLEAIQGTVEAVAETKAGGGVKLGYTGRPVFVAEISSSMQRDITLSVFGTAVIIAILFWLAHRRWKPMLWLLTLLAVVLAATLALGGLLFGAINVISMGFAAILLGLAVDYAVVHYQEALAHPNLSVPQIRRAIAPSIFWAAVTTIAAFLVLNFGGLPGLAQLGSLVGIGVALAALVMIFAFLPPLFPERMDAGRRDAGAPGEETGRRDGGAPKDAGATKNEGGFAGRSSPQSGERHGEEARRRDAGGTLMANVIVTAGLAVVCTLVLLPGLPGMNPSADTLRPRDSQAYETLDTLRANLSQNRDPLWVLVTGRDEGAVAARLAAIEPVLQAAVSNGTLASYSSPALIWPQPAFQAGNRAAAQGVIAGRAKLHAAAHTAGFAPEALGLADKILETWERATSSPSVFWPTNALCSWILEKMVARGAGGWYAAGFLFPNDRGGGRDGERAAVKFLGEQLPRDGVWLSGWQLLGDSAREVVQRNFWKLVVPMVALVLLSLWLAFRRWGEILLSLGTLALSALVLLAVMKLAGWSWTLLNLMAAPLILGTGVDYSLFMQLALRRHGGDLKVAHRSVGRALLLCGGTAVAGFGMLGLSSNAGMASLGQVCAVGIAGNMLISVWLLPAWWRMAGAKEVLARPSSFYSARLWHLGSKLAHWLPLAVSESMARGGSAVYWFFARHRREVVEQNLLPALNGDRRAAGRAARRLFSNFAVKVVDLWQYEGGAPMQQLVKSWRGWEIIAAAQARGRGVLFVTPHLGNWELGGAFLVQRGCKLLVLTQAEPEEELTAMREAARARLGVDTLVVGQDAFGFVEVIKRLQAGENVALLVDRPPPATAVSVELFGRPFPASIAAAELARATGCGLVPVVIVRDGDGYSAEVLPEVSYERSAVGDRAGRIRLTQEILRALEPAIRQHVEQWYHFVPVWEARANAK
jgi:predicted RND superfamily exporter protein/lauroyl/myristoyl acyltransferase